MLGQPVVASFCKRSAMRPAGGYREFFPQRFTKWITK
jgi:hypothetical protein